MQSEFQGKVQRPRCNPSLTRNLDLIGIFTGPQTALLFGRSLIEYKVKELDFLLSDVLELEDFFVGRKQVNVEV